jgi:hypothetical protein
VAGNDEIPDEAEADEREETPNAADPAQNKRRETKQALRQREERAWWQAALGTEVGRRCLWQILSAAKTFDEPFGVTDAGFPHPQATWFIAGKQKAGLDLYHTWLRLDPIAVAAMHREQDGRFIQTKEIK